MTPWTHTLPDVERSPAGPQEHAERALIALTWALRAERHPDESAYLLGVVRDAAAHLRAWRKSLPEQGERAGGGAREYLTDRELLRVAIRCITLADGSTAAQAKYLRAAEYALRVLGKRLAAREES